MAFENAIVTMSVVRPDEQNAGNRFDCPYIIVSELIIYLKKKAFGNELASHTDLRVQ